MSLSTELFKKDLSFKRKKSVEESSKLLKITNFQKSIRIQTLDTFTLEGKQDILNKRRNIIPINKTKLSMSAHGNTIKKLRHEFNIIVDDYDVLENTNKNTYYEDVNLIENASLKQEKAIVEKELDILLLKLKEYKDSYEILLNENNFLKVEINNIKKNFKEIEIKCNNVESQLINCKELIKMNDSISNSPRNRKMIIFQLFLKRILNLKNNY